MFWWVFQGDDVFYLIKTTYWRCGIWLWITRGLASLWSSLWYNVAESTYMYLLNSWQKIICCFKNNMFWWFWSGHVFVYLDIMRLHLAMLAPWAPRHLRNLSIPSQLCLCTCFTFEFFHFYTFPASVCTHTWSKNLHFNENKIMNSWGFMMNASILTANIFSTEIWKLWHEWLKYYHFGSILIV